MTKFQAGVCYEMQKLLKHAVFFIVGAAAFMGVIQLVFRAFGSEFVRFGGVGSFAFFFIVFWTAIAFGKDTGFFLQSGLTRREVFKIFVLAVVVEALVFALLDAVLSLAVPGFWVEQSFFLRMAGSYSAALFLQVFLLNLAVASCTLAVNALQRRVGTGWTVAFLIGLYALATVVLPAFFFLFPGGIEAYGGFMAALMWSPYVPAMPFVFYLIVALASTLFTGVLLHRVSAERIAAER